MPKIAISANQLRKSSDAYMELFNDEKLQIFALKGGRFEVVCGSTHAIAHSLQEIADKVDAMELHACALDGQQVIASIQKKLGSQYRLEIHAAKDDTTKVVHSVEGSKESLACDMNGSIPVDVSTMNPGQRYALSPNMFGGDYAVLIPMNTLGLPEMSPGLSPNQMWETQPLSKGDVVQGICPITGAVIKIMITNAYPNGSIQDNNGKIYSADEVAQLQFCKVQDSPEPAFSEPDLPLYDSENIPTYNPTGEVEKVAPMIGNLANYNTILEASGGILGDFMRKSSKFALADKCSLNKIRVSGIDKKGQATDGDLEWNVKIASPYYQRSSYITIPMTMVKGDLNLGKYFIASTGQKFPLTVEALDTHLGRLADDPLSHFAKQSAHPSTLKCDADIDAICEAVATKKTAGGESWDDVVMQQEAIMSSETKEDAVQKLKDMGYVSTFSQTGETEPETIEECVDRVWDLYKDPAWDELNKEGSKKTASEKASYGDNDIQLTELDNGNLRISLTETSDKEDIARRLEERGSDATLYELMDSAIGNGWAILSPEDIGALTDSPILAYDVGSEDKPNEVHAGSKVWWFPNYQVEDPIQTLLDTGAVIFTAAQDAPTGTDKEGSKKKTAVDAKEVAETVLEKDKPLNNIPGGKAEGEKPSNFDKGQLEKGIKVEMEHTDNPEVAAEIATDHLAETPAHNKEYYNKLEDKVEKPLEQKADAKVSGKLKGPGIPDGTGPFGGTSRCQLKNRRRNEDTVEKPLEQKSETAAAKKTAAKSMEELKTLWEQLGKVPTDDEGRIQESFLQFNVGDSLENVWQWFEEQNPEFSVHAMLYPESVEAAKKEAAKPFPSDAASVSYDPETGTVQLHDRVGGWISPDLAPAAAYKVAKEYYDSWAEFKKKLGIKKMKPIDFNDKYFITIGGRGGSSDLGDSLSSDITENITSIIESTHEELDYKIAQEIAMEIDVDYDMDAVENGVIEYVWKKHFPSEDNNAVGKILDKLDDEDMMWTRLDALNEQIEKLDMGDIEGKVQEYIAEHQEELAGKLRTKEMKEQEAEGQQVLPGLERGKASLKAVSTKRARLVPKTADGQLEGEMAVREVRKLIEGEGTSWNWVDKLIDATINMRDLGADYVSEAEQDIFLAVEECCETLLSVSDVDKSDAVAVKNELVEYLAADDVTEKSKVTNPWPHSGSKKTADWAQHDMLQKAIMGSETKEEAVQKLKDGGYKSDFIPQGSDKEETIEELVARLWDNYKESYDPAKPENKAIALIDAATNSYIEALPTDVEGAPDFYQSGIDPEVTWMDEDEIPEEEKEEAQAVYVLDTLSNNQGDEHFKDMLISAVRDEISEDELSDDDLEELVSNWDTDLGNELSGNLAVNYGKEPGDIMVVLYKDVVPTQEEVMKERESEGQQIIPGLERGKASKK